MGSQRTILLHSPLISGAGAGHTGLCGSDFSAAAEPSDGFINGDARERDGGCTWDSQKVTCEPCRAKLVLEYVSKHPDFFVRLLGTVREEAISEGRRQAREKIREALGINDVYDSGDLL